MSALIINKMQGRLKICAVKSPGFGDNKTAILHDIAILTGAQVVASWVALPMLLGVKCYLDVRGTFGTL